MISNMWRAAKISSQQIYRAAIAGNTTMEHLMMGINADPLRMEPYIPAFFKTNSLFASDVNLAIHPTPISFWHRTSEAMWAEILLPARWSA